MTVNISIPETHHRTLVHKLQATGTRLQNGRTKARESLQRYCMGSSLCRQHGVTVRSKAGDHWPKYSGRALNIFRALLYYPDMRYPQHKFRLS